MRHALIAAIVLAASPVLAQTPATGPSALPPSGGATPALGQPSAAAPANSVTVPEQVSPTPVGPASSPQPPSPSGARS